HFAHSGGIAPASGPNLNSHFAHSGGIAPASGPNLN
mgnify:CR=1